MLKSEVLFVAEDFVLVLLKGHASGRLAYLPVRKVNDILMLNCVVVFWALQCNLFALCSEMVYDQKSV